MVSDTSNQKYMLINLCRSVRHPAAQLELHKIRKFRTTPKRSHRSDNRSRDTGETIVLEKCRDTGLTFKVRDCAPLVRVWAPGTKACKIRTKSIVHQNLHRDSSSRGLRSAASSQVVRNPLAGCCSSQKLTAKRIEHVEFHGVTIKCFLVHHQAVLRKRA